MRWLVYIVCGVAITLSFLAMYERIDWPTFAWTLITATLYDIVIKR
jgi:hypothetical protein